MLETGSLCSAWLKTSCIDIIIPNAASNSPNKIVKMKQKNSYQDNFNKYFNFLK